MKTSKPQHKTLRRWFFFGIAWLAAALFLVACPTGVTPLQEGGGATEGGSAGGERTSTENTSNSESPTTEAPSSQESNSTQDGPSSSESLGDSSTTTDLTNPNKDQDLVERGLPDSNLPEPGPEPGTTTPDEGKLGDTCQTACDCSQGLDCQQGKCVQPSLPIYCCDKPLCPQNEVCITRQGSRGQCPSGPSCTGTCDCPQGQICLNGGCRALSSPVYCCDKSGCPEGNTCFDKQGTQKTCPKAGQPQGCQHTCDCSQGLLCIQGSCVNTGGNPVYCCDSPNCPAGRSCVWRVGGFGNCKPNNIQCKSACDCQTGETCYNGACIKSGSPTYCCSRKDNCPSGQLCQDPQGTLRICGSGKACTTNCDCPTQEQCFNGNCIGSTQSVVPCCSSQTCPQGQLCIQSSGSFSTCP